MRTLGLSLGAGMLAVLFLTVKGSVNGIGI